MGLLVLTGLAACLVPARRAAAVDPNVALHEGGKDPGSGPPVAGAFRHRQGLSGGPAIQGLITREGR